MEPHADVQAPGAAVTVALCGHWDHEPPCPLAPQHVSAADDDGELRVRILFAARTGQRRRGSASHRAGPVRTAEVPGRLHHPVAAARKLAQ